MKIQRIGLEKINGPLVYIKTPKDASFEEQVELVLPSGEIRLGNVITLSEDATVIQVYEGTNGMNSKGIKTEFTGKPLKLKLSKEMLGRIFDGAGRPIDGLMTLIRGQKLPIFSGSGINHNKLAEKIIRQANIKDDSNFAIVFGLIGAEYETAEFFRKSFEENGILEKVVTFQNLSNDPSIERILTPKVALTCAEYLAFELDMQVLVILTDMTAYAEALREVSTLKGEIPSRKGYPGYLYSDFASIYERAGKIRGKKGSITQIPILTMPNDDISHPIPDITGYITEGQIVLSRDLSQKGINPPINILDSLSRLMKDGIGEKFTRADHREIADQLFTSYSKVQDVRALAKVLGESDLSETDKKYLEFGEAFENKWLNQDTLESRTIEQTLDLAWEILKILPESEWSKLNVSKK